VPSITEYTAPTGLTPQPTDIAASTAREAGAVENRLGHETGEALGGAIGRVGGQLGAEVDNHLTSQAIGQGAAASAQMYSDLTSQWNQLAAKTDPNDASISQTFREKTLEPALQKFQQSFESSSPRAQEWALRQSDAMRQDFFRTTAADSSTRAGMAAQQNLEVMERNFSNTVHSDASKLPFVEQSLHQSVQSMIETSPFISADMATKMQAEIEPKIMKEIAKSAAAGIGLSNPDQLIAEIGAGKWDKYFDQGEQGRILLEAQRFKEANYRDQEQAWVLKQRAAKDLSDTTAAQYLADLPAKGMSNAQVLADPRLDIGERQRLVSFNHAFAREAADRSENAQHPEAFRQLMTDSINAHTGGQDFDAKPWDTAFTTGKISYAEYMKGVARGAAFDRPFERSFNSQMQQVDSTIKSSMWASMNTAHPEKTAGVINQIESDARAVVDQYRQQGKDVRPLLNPASPEYLFAPTKIQTYMGNRASLSAGADAVRQSTAAPTSAKSSFVAGQVYPFKQGTMRYKGGDPTNAASWEAAQ
jgi:hypothetical protein